LRRSRLLLAPAVLAFVLGAAACSAGESQETETVVVTQAAPPPRPLRIVFPEGFTRKEMAARITAVNKIAKQKRDVSPRLRARQYLELTRRHILPGRFAGDRRPRQLEGFLFPATYDFFEETTTKQLIREQLEAFERAWASVDLKYAKSKKLTPYDVLIIASMIEKEAVVNSERPLIAAVIYNRLKIGLQLGIDATIRYGLDVPGTESLRESQLESDNPYNTRTRVGLPPTPIANPGLASIKAAANPARTKYLYFLRKPDSQRHFFTASEDEFFRKRCEYGYPCG
jgi:UPF0755 protein